MRLSIATLLALGALGVAAPGMAAKGDCGQPVSTGSGPTASDCLFILQTAIGVGECMPACICNFGGGAVTTATDALLCLKVAVRQTGVTLSCFPQPCPPISTTTSSTSTSTSITMTSATTTTTIPTSHARCSSADFTIRSGSNLDMGWKGTLYDGDIAAGGTISLRVVRRCSNDDSVCTKDADCAGGSCKPTCDCDDPQSSVCELAGPTHQSRCLASLTPCAADADCPTGESCEHFFGPPVPFEGEGTAICITEYFSEDATGTVDTETGDVDLSVLLRARVHHGVALDQPCPRCGPPDQHPRLGDAFTCEGGPNDGAACTVDAISPAFGGVSYACALDVATNISGLGVAMRLDELTTGSTSRSAVLPCAPPLDFHPANGNAFCLNDTNTTCTSNADCEAFGGTCGLYCHCGYCGGDVDLPCFGDDQCPQGMTCEPGTPKSAAEPQSRPNLCQTLVCGAEQGSERCDSSTPPVGECSLATYRFCSTNTDCSFLGAGECILSPRPCFENTITREGAASPLGRHCVDDPAGGACTSNADCTVGSCEDDTAEPTSVALFCVPPTTGPNVNSSFAIPGPAAIELDSVLRMCRCGDGVIGCDEECEVGDESACPGACDLENCLCE